MVIEWYNLLLH